MWKSEVGTEIEICTFEKLKYIILLSPFRRVPGQVPELCCKHIPWFVSNEKSAEFAPFKYFKLLRTYLSELSGYDHTSNYVDTSRPASQWLSFGQLATISVDLGYFEQSPIVPFPFEKAIWAWDSLTNNRAGVGTWPSHIWRDNLF